MFQSKIVASKKLKGETAKYKHDCNSARTTHKVNRDAEEGSVAYKPRQGRNTFEAHGTCVHICYRLPKQKKKQ